MSDRALTFGAVAEMYERFRPSYPHELVELVLAYAQGPVSTALEIGAGTGKATRVFAAHGIKVTATDPDPAMLAELRRHVPFGVQTVQASLESLPLGDTYDLMYAAAALHWTRQEGRWERVAALVRAGGIFASFGGPIQLADQAVADVVREAREPFLASDDVAPPEETPPGSMQWPGTELQRADCFADVRESVVVRRLTMSAHDYVGQLSTVSAYLQLPAHHRNAAFASIMRVLPDEVEVVADLTVHLARRC